jgi:DNA (cytosine-5)-methyltransferase 1
MSSHLFPYNWNLSDGYPANGIPKNNLKVFGTFVCGGGSTMGYKLAGFTHLGGVEIDPQVAKIYATNHNPKFLYNADIREFNKMEDLPEELFNLDLLDGSPPCSTFSMAGAREKYWGVQKKFSEGQEKQTLDDLVFVYCDTIIKLKPKTFLLENVKGIIQGNAKTYSKNIVKKMTEAGYTVQVFCLNAATMGVPQKRERVFFIGHLKELNFPKLKLEFNEKPIYFKHIAAVTKDEPHRSMTKVYFDLWKKVKEGRSLSDAHPTGSRFSSFKLNMNDCMPTLTSTAGTSNHYSRADMPVYTNDNEWKLGGSYPMDYNFLDINPKYLIGMSVPPVMTAQIANQIKLQWFPNEA